MTNCEGCDARDEIIRTLAERIDELEGNDILELPPMPERVGRIDLETQN